MLACDGPDQDGQCVGGHHAERGADPHAHPVVVRREGYRREHRLVAEFGKKERRRDREERGCGGSLGPGRFVIREPVASQRPQSEQNERHSGQDAEQMRRQCGTEVMADRHGDEVHRRRRESDAAEDHPPAMTQRERHRHQLGLVPEFGDEDDGEAQQQGGEHALLPVRCGCRSEM